LAVAAQEVPYQAELEAATELLLLADLFLQQAVVAAAHVMWLAQD
jgi:hypothetical protein